MLTVDLKARGAELKRLMNELALARMAMGQAVEKVQQAYREVERIENVLWAIGADLDGRP